jgi:phosphoglycolate phosphatase-like HAD superfamily hydrolase
MRLCEKKILVFDFDGTIANTFEAMLSIINEFSEQFDFKTIEPFEAQLLRDMPWQAIRRYLNIPLFKIPLLVAQLHQQLPKQWAVIKPVKGLKPVLFNLKERGHNLAIVTSNSAENVHFF